MKITKRWGLLALAVAAVVALAFAACGDDDDADAESNGTDLAAVQEQATKAQVLAAMTVFRVEGLHEIDDAAQKASEIEAGWSGQVSRMHTAMKSVQWPEELKAAADSLTVALAELKAALDEDDLEAVKELSAEAHQQWHDFEHDTDAYLSGEEHGDEGAGHSDEETSTGDAGHSDGGMATEDTGHSAAETTGMEEATEAAH